MRIRLIDKVFEIQPLNDRFAEYCSGYLTDDPADFHLEYTADDITTEKERYHGNSKVELAPWQYEAQMVYRRIATVMPLYDAILFHGSTLALDGQGYLFTAKSGTGKSTHTRLWKEHFGSRVTLINDDKPLLKLEGDSVMAYGTPWCGKHGLNTNTFALLKAICILERGETDSIEKVDPAQQYKMLLQQCFHPEEQEALKKTLEILDRILQLVEVYVLHCTISDNAVVTAWEGMRGKTMKLNSKFIIHDTDNEQIMVSADRRLFAGMVRNNETAAFMVRLLENEITEDEIVAAMLQEYNVEESVLRQDVARALDKLRSIGALDE